jgi:hypothetical protein
MLYPVEIRHNERGKERGLSVSFDIPKNRHFWLRFQGTWTVLRMDPRTSA